jgi:hypothetical protein
MLRSALAALVLLPACGGAPPSAADESSPDIVEPERPANCAHSLYADWTDETVSPPVAHQDIYEAAYAEGVFTWDGEPVSPRFEFPIVGIIEMSYEPGDFRVVVNGQLLRSGCDSDSAPSS